ncbi:uncharacterized protein At5g43822 isoform X2 [Prosopis cineraria]|uniref:uncharacterized protein At5g43822 isoform X2 n=1 Tax=Prosopis cineraria TaxID=364024 RepID=UPI00240F7070|nr:uncharacterized protein At5g43822 isoform X2 [Prosopis cineraria]
MEVMVNKFQAKYKKAREEISRWDELQSHLVSQFRNASSIIDRLQVLQNSKNYANLIFIGGIQDALLSKQMGSLENIMVSMRSTVEEFHKIVLSLERIHRDGRQLVKGGSSCPTMKQLQQRLGIKPSLTDCLDGLLFLHDIHDSEYQLKTSIILAVSAGALKLSGNDLSELLQLLIDQPNIPSEEVQFVFDVICAEEC